MAGGRYAMPDDVKALAGPVVAHRLIGDMSAQLRDMTRACIVADIVAATPVPIELGYSVGLIADGMPPRRQAPSMIRAGRGPRQRSSVLRALGRVQSLVIRPLEELIQDMGADALPFGATIVIIMALQR